MGPKSQEEQEQQSAGAVARRGAEERGARNRPLWLWSPSAPWHDGLAWESILFWLII